MKSPAAWSRALVPRSPPAASRETADGTCTADQALTRLYAEHSRSLLRLAALLVHDTAAAEEITETAFAAMYDAWRWQRDTAVAVAFLRQAVVRQAPIVQRRQTGTEGGFSPGSSRTRQDAIAGLERGAIVAMLLSLPDRQREAVVLRCYSELSEEQAAAAMGVSRAAVRRHTTRALAALRAKLDRDSGLKDDDGYQDVNGPTVR